MHKINLTPEELIENKYWFVPDLIALVLILVISYYSSSLYIKSIHNHIEAISAEIELVNKKNEELQSDIKFYDNLKKKKIFIDQRIATLEDLLSSRVSRYLPVLTLQMLHNAMPIGVWLSYLEYDGLSSQLLFTAGSYNGYLIAEYITNLKKLSQDKKKKNTLLDYVSFEKIILDRITYTGTYSYDDQNKNKMIRSQDEDSDAIKKRDKFLKKTVAHWNDSKKHYPYISKYPVFNVLIYYRSTEMGI